MNWQERIAADPTLCRGEAFIKGTRAMVSVGFDNLAAAKPAEEILHRYHLRCEDIEAAITYAADWPANSRERPGRRHMPWNEGQSADPPSHAQLGATARERFEQQQNSNRAGGLRLTAAQGAGILELVGTRRSGSGASDSV